MAVHRVPRDELEVSLRQLVRTGERVDSTYEDGDDWVIVTEDRIETRGGAS